MKDPAKPPGFRFLELRLLRAHVEVAPDLRILPDDARPGFEYRDRVEVVGTRVRIVQDARVRFRKEAPESPDLLTVEISLEGTFEGSESPNIPPDEFAQRHAPAILFPFLRECVHRFTSNLGTIPAILLPPFNVIALRELQRPRDPAPPSSPREVQPRSRPE